MPFTKDENSFYSITVRHEGRDRQGYEASAEIYRRDRPETVGKVRYGRGPTLIAAERQAYAAARSACPQRQPDDWNDSDDTC